jgi:methylmalonyl-CoA mutase cobalamin-binding domain/chain
MGKTLPQALASFDEDFVMAEVKNRLTVNENPVLLVKELQQGMSLVGERFSSGEYFLSELLMSADLFSRVMEMVEPKIENQTIETIGRIVIGTPKGDIHDLGKNIFCTVARSSGFEIYDLGVDVPPEKFVAAVEEHKPQILGFSALITTTFDMMKNVVDKLVEKDLRDDLKIIIGGGVTTGMVENYVGADGQTIDALEGLSFCKRFLNI